MLARAGSRGVTRDKLLAYLWPETDAERGGHRLTQLLYSLRRDLGADDLFLSAGGELRLNPLSITVDVAEFSDALERHELEAAVSGYSGPFLDGFYIGGSAEFDAWVEGERSELDRQYRSALESLAERAGEEGRWPEAARWWGQVVQADPLNSRTAARYIDALAAAGDRGGALRFARLHEERVRQELGTEPDRAVLSACERLAAGRARSDIPSIAVLPFVNLSPDRENEYFSDGMTEELTNMLTRVPGLRVASRTSAFALKGKKLDVRDIGARLSVDTMVEGSVRKVGDRIRVTAQLISTADGYQLWSATYDRTVEDVFALQEELSRAIMGALPLGTPMPAASPRASTGVLDAYMLYLRGRFHALKRSPDALRVGIEYLEQAVERDPSYALAHAGLAECWALLGFEEFGDCDPTVAMPRAKAAALRALELDPQLPEGHTWLGAVTFLFDYDNAAAEKALRRAIELRPEHTFAHTWYAVLMFGTGRYDEAILRAQHAAELDPLAVTVQAVIGMAYYFARRYEEAIATLASVIQIDRDSVRTHSWMLRAYRRLGQIGRALEFVQETMGRLGRAPILLEQYGRLLGVAGRRREAFEVLSELGAMRESRFVSKSFDLGIYLSLGLEDEARPILEELFEQHSPRMAFLRAEPDFDPLRDREWFRALVQRADVGR